MCTRHSQCPFCRTEEPDLLEPDIAVVKRRRIQVDEEWVPRPGVSVPPRASVRATRRTVYIYDYDDEETEQVEVDEEPPTPPTLISAPAQAAFDAMWGGTDHIEFPSPAAMELAAVINYLPPAAVQDAFTISDDDDDEDDGVEESKDGTV